MTDEQRRRFEVRWRALARGRGLPEDLIVAPQITPETIKRFSRSKRPSSIDDVVWRALTARCENLGLDPHPMILLGKPKK